MTKGVKVPLKKVEETRKKLIALNLLDVTKKLKKVGNTIILPVTSTPKGFKVIESDFEDIKRSKGFKDRLTEFLPEGKTVTSFDIIGEIAIFEIPDDLVAFEDQIAEAMLSTNKSIKSVYKKAGEVKGSERLREFKLLAGKPSTKTVYKEHGIYLKLDISKVYFSPRLSHEREKILKQVKDGELIVDLFAGVGPFSVLLAKYRDVKVYAIDINPVACDYLKENIRINKVADRVVPLQGDCRALAPKGASRVIMNLPKSSHEFLDLAFDILKKGIIHYYAISPEQDLYDSKIDFIKKTGKKKGRHVKILDKRIVRPYSPYHYHVAIDIGVD